MILICCVRDFLVRRFLLAGKRLGFEETRGTLFFDVAEIIRRKRPKAFFWKMSKVCLFTIKGKQSKRY